MNKTNVKNLLTLTVIIIIAVLGMCQSAKTAQAQIVGNVIKDGSFEDSNNGYWNLWQTGEDGRVFESYRSYDPPYGFGSYALAIEGQGRPSNRFSAGLVGNEKNNFFAVDSSKRYKVSFYAKANQPLAVSVYLENSTGFAAISSIEERSVSTEWQRFTVFLTPSLKTNSVLTFVFGDMPTGGTLLLDGVSLVEDNMTITTQEVKCSISDKNKPITVSSTNGNQVDDYEIELPYFNNETGEASYKRFNPEKIDSKSLFFNCYEKTFSGAGKIYLNGTMFGQFDYIVQPKIKEYFPKLARADEDFTVVGSGFSPIDGQTFVIVKVIDVKGKKYDLWIKPVNIDSNLNEATIKLPNGIVSGTLFVKNSSWSIKNKEISAVSNSLAYKVKPVINRIAWSKRGFEQVGDKMKIYGKGISNNPTINFYDSNNKLVSSAKAKVLDIAAEETIEFTTPVNYNNYKITVKVDTVESDQESALNYEARPKIKTISTKYKRNINNSAEYVSAAKVGDEITINGQGLYTPNVQTYVEFVAGTDPISIPVAESKLDKNGQTLKVTVPAGAQNGQLRVKINNLYSNVVVLEIIPTINSILPNPIWPGENITIETTGVGQNINLAKVIFKTGKDEISVTPAEIHVGYSNTIIIVTSPLNVSSQYTTLTVKYGYWNSDGKFSLEAKPYIKEAQIDLDDKILTIRGFGFSTNMKENEIIYKYADENKTVIKPKVNVLGIFTTDGGQEIRVRILDNYHYGYVTVKTKGVESNEVNFGPTSISKITRRIEYVKSEGRVMGVLYINGYNFGSQGDVKVGDIWAKTHYRTNFFIIAVVEKADIYKNPVIVTK